MSTKGGQHRWYATFLFIIFCVVVMLTLLNLLVALMGDTYNSIIEDGVEDDWPVFGRWGSCLF